VRAGRRAKQLAKEAAVDAVAELAGAAVEVASDIISNL
jgi:hypothetical protein